jgi:hypothetical protein
VLATVIITLPLLFVNRLKKLFLFLSQKTVSVLRFARRGS